MSLSVNIHPPKPPHFFTVDTGGTATHYWAALSIYGTKEIAFFVKTKEQAEAIADALRAAYGEPEDVAA